MDYSQTCTLNYSIAKNTRKKRRKRNQIVKVELKGGKMH